MPDFITHTSSSSSHTASPPAPVPRPPSASLVSPPSAVPTLSSSNPSSPQNADPHKASIISKGKLKAKDPPLPSSPHLPPSTPGSPRSSGSQSPPLNNSQSSPNLPSKPPAERPFTNALHLDQYITRDLLHAAALASQTRDHHDLIRTKRKEIEYYQTLRRERQHNPGAVFGPGYQGYGNGFTNGKSRILYPCERKRPGGRRARELRIPRSRQQTQAEEGETLVPIRLDIDWDKIKLRDTFTWNLHDRTVPIEVFAEQLVEDFHLPLSPPLINLISKSIADQVTDFHPHVHLPDEPLLPNLPYWAYKNDEMRVLIKLNITIGQHTLVDQFEWDINDPSNSPEEFARLLTRDMCLSGEFTTAIAHAIREQSQLYTKSLYMTGHAFDGRPIEDVDLRTAMLASPLPGIMRPAAQAKEYTPILYELSDNELEKVEKSLTRENRRKRRVGRRGGPSLPELREMPKTIRSQIVSAVLPGAVQKVSDLKISSDKNKEPDSDDDSGSDSPPPPTPPPAAPLSLSTMTRRQRGAAANAAAALRASAGRSATPEVSHIHQHTPLHNSHLSHVTHVPASSVTFRRPGVPFNVDSAVVKLRISRDRLQRWMVEQQKRDQKKVQEQKLEWSKRQKQHQISIANNVAAGAGPEAGQSVGVSAKSALAASTSGTVSAQANGRIEPGNPPPTPEWLVAGLAQLKQTYPNDNFEGIMKYTPLCGVTGAQITTTNPPQDPNNIRHKFLPRIRCHDCPGKLYTPGQDQTETVENFKLHLNNRGHRTRVDERVGGVSSGRVGGKMASMTGTAT